MTVFAAAAAQSGDFTWPDVAVIALFVVFVVFVLGAIWLVLR